MNFICQTVRAIKLKHHKTNKRKLNNSNKNMTFIRFLRSHNVLAFIILIVTLTIFILTINFAIFFSIIIKNIKFNKQRKLFNKNEISLR